MCELSQVTPGPAGLSMARSHRANSSQLRSNEQVSGREVGHKQRRGVGEGVGARESREGEADGDGKEEKEE